MRYEDIAAEFRFKAPIRPACKPTPAELAERKLALRRYLARHFPTELDKHDQFAAAMQAVATIGGMGRPLLQYMVADARQVAEAREVARRARARDEEALARRIAETSPCSLSRARQMIEDIKRALDPMTPEQAVRYGLMIYEVAASNPEEPWQTRTTGNASSGSSWPGHQRTRSSPRTRGGRGRRSSGRSGAAKRSRKRGRRRGR